GDGRVLPVYRALARLRMRLVPYLAREARASVAQRKPLMRAPFFEHPHDPDVWRFPYQYYLGDELLVAPVVEPGATTLHLYLPAGEWIELWDGEPHEGPSELDAAAPLERIPVFVRAAAAGRLRRKLGL